MFVNEFTLYMHTSKVMTPISLLLLKISNGNLSRYLKIKIISLIVVTRYKHHPNNQNHVHPPLPPTPSGLITTRNDPRSDSLSTSGKAASKSPSRVEKQLYGAALTRPGALCPHNHEHKALARKGRIIPGCCCRRLQKTGWPPRVRATRAAEAAINSSLQRLHSRPFMRRLVRLSGNKKVVLRNQSRRVAPLLTCVHYTAANVRCIHTVYRTYIQRRTEARRDAVERHF